MRRTRRPNFPACFPTAQSWLDWYELAGDTVRPCEDCTPGYRDQMRAGGRCEHPETAFVIDKHGFVRGVRPSRKLPDRAGDAPSGSKPRNCLMSETA